MNKQLTIVLIALFVFFVTTVCAMPSGDQAKQILDQANEIASTAVKSAEEAQGNESNEPAGETQGSVPVTSVTQAPQAAMTACDPANAAWIGTRDYGLICLDNAGWHVFTEDNSPLSSDYIKDIAVCGDGRVYIVSTSGVDSTDGSTWLSYDDQIGYNSVEALACGPDGELWIAQYEGAQHFDGTQWVKYDYQLFGTGEFNKSVKDIAVDRNGDAWLVTTNSVAHFDGSQWTYFEEGKGFDDLYYFENIMIDCDNNVWVSQTSGVMRYADGSWQKFDNGDLFQAKKLALAGNSCTVWAGTYSKGVSVFNGQGWVTYNRKTSGISSEKILTVALDGQDRAWIGTEWGLNVFDGSTWSAYHMHNSALTDNEIYAIAVSGSGPNLPDWQVKDTGSLSGTLKKNGSALSGVTVEACTEFIGMIFSGSSPCADNPLRAEVKTDGSGSFNFTGLPIGRYSIAFQSGDGKWMRLTGSFGIGDRDVLVTEGANFDLGEINVTEE